MGARVKPKRVLCAGLLLGGLVVAATRVPALAGGAGAFTEHTYTSAFGSRAYWLFVPTAPAHPLSMVVFLHGCNQTAPQAASASHFDVLAERLGFVVVYPQQNVTVDSSAPLADGNGIGCWNWFLPEDQQAGAGEPAIIAGLTEQVAKQEQVDSRRIYVEGLSAGADMAVILGATYPNLYAAVGVVAGCAYRACSDATGVATNQAMGVHARVVPMFVENGTADTLNNMAMASGLVTSWLGADNLADSSDPVSPAPVSTETYGADQTPKPLSGDYCIHNDSLTCPGGAIGFQGSYPYSVATWNDAAGCDVLELWAIHGMEHAEPDAPGDGPYTDPLGPDITAASYDFFSHHAMASVGGGCTSRKASQ